MLMLATGESLADPANEQPLAGPSGIEALVLAGSQTWRDTPFDNLMPRPLLPVAQLPLIAYSLRWLRAAGAPRATVCANGFCSTIHEHLRPFRRSLPPLAFHDDPAPRGAAGSVRDAALATDADLFVVIDATTIPTVNLGRVIDEHRRTGAALTIVVQPATRDDAAANRGLVPTGIYVFSRRAIDAIPAAGYQDIKESLIPRLYASGELVTTSEAEGACPRVLDARTYLAVSHRIISKAASRADVFTDAETASRTSAAIHPRARVSPSALLIGPILVDADAEILAEATIVGPASIGAGSIVSAGALVSRSVLWARCVVRQGAVVDRSILADDVRVEDGQRLVGAVKSSGRVQRPAPVDAGTPLPELEPAVTGLAFR